MYVLPPQGMYLQVVHLSEIRVLDCIQVVKLDHDKVNLRGSDATS